MSAFTLTIDTSNAAFGPTPADRGAEIARILAKIGAALQTGYPSAQGEKLHDINGNACGSFELTAFDFAAHE